MKKNAGSLRTAPIIILLITLAFSTPVLAQTIDFAAPDPVVLTDGQVEYPLGLYLEILEDPTGELSIEQVSSPPYEAQFTASQVPVPNFGFSD